MILNTKPDQTTRHTQKQGSRYHIESRWMHLLYIRSKYTPFRPMFRPIWSECCGFLLFSIAKSAISIEFRNIRSHGCLLDKNLRSAYSIRILACRTHAVPLHPLHKYIILNAKLLVLKTNSSFQYRIPRFKYKNHHVYSHGAPVGLSYATITVNTGSRFIVSSLPSCSSGQNLHSK